MELRIPCLDPFKIAASGQCFRMNIIAPDMVTADAGRARLTIKALGGELFGLDCARDEFDGFWRYYLDLDADYDAIEAKAMEADSTLAAAAHCCHGMRILRQEPWEALISFIISQRRSIKSIKTCVERLCERFGEGIECADGVRYAFPTPRALASAGEAELRACGVGYRAPYLLDAARRTLTGALPLDALRELSNDELQAALMEVHGVGIKVASCVMLFGYHRMDISPVDVWIKRVIEQSYGGVSPFEAYGEYAGIYQQYLFFSQIGDAQMRGTGANA